MLEELVWLVIFAICVTIATIMIKILIEFPGFLKFKCIYKDEAAGNDFEEVVDVDVEQIMKHYESQMKKNKSRTKSRVSIDLVSCESDADTVRKLHKHKHKHRNRDVKQIEKNFNEKEISIEVDDEKISEPACIPSEIPHQLTITVNDNKSDPVDNNNIAAKVPEISLKTVAVIEHHEAPPAIEITAHSKHGHVRQH